MFYALNVFVACKSRQLIDCNLQQPPKKKI
jgi:hypothetical protein